MRILLRFHNEDHQELGFLELTDIELKPEQTVESAIAAPAKEKLQELGWKQYGFYAEHEPVFEGTTFAEVAYLVQDGTLTMDCEDHHCSCREIRVPVVRTELCSLCGKKNDQVSSLSCMHYCVCGACFQRMQSCPICAKPKVSWQPARLEMT